MFPLRPIWTLGLLAALLIAQDAWAGPSPVDEGDAAYQRRDCKTALKLLMPLARQGDPVAELDVGLMYFGGCGLPENRTEAAKWFLASAKQGQSGAQVNIGVAYATGAGVQKDYVKAYIWFSMAADQGVAEAAKYREHLATEMTPEQIGEAQRRANVCRLSNYRSCGD